MKVSIDEVKYIAKLSKLKFSDEEAAKFASEFEGILNNFQYLNELDLEIEDDMDKEELKPIIKCLIVSEISWTVENIVEKFN